MNKIFVISLVLIFAWGIFLRAFDLGGASFWIDEGYSSITSYYALLNSFLPILETGSYSFSRYFFTFFQTLSFSIFGISDLTARLPSIVFGIGLMILSIIFAYDLLKNHKYRLIGTFGISFLSFFSTWQIIWSREARFYELLAFLLLLGVYLIYKYSIDKKIGYLVGFCIIAGIGSIYHPFLFSLFAVGGVYLFYEFIISFFGNDLKSKVFKKYIRYGLIFIGGYLLYFLINMLFRYISTGGVELSSGVPNTYDLPENFKDSYVNFYSEIFFRELGFLYLVFILGIFYLGYIKNYAYLIIFGGIFLINFYIISQKGIMLHSRYMYHLYSIITIFGGYVLFLFLSYLYDLGKSIKNKFYKSSIFLIFGSLILFVVFSFNITLIPKTTYYIDNTSPKPDFKSAYEFIGNNYANKNIISGMPQLCVWYNLENKDICNYALKVNLTGRKSSNKIIMQQTNHNYTNTPYIDNIDSIKNSVVVLDDLSIRMSIQRNIINYVLNSCQIVFEDNGNGESYNYIGVWNCD